MRYRFPYVGTDLRLTSPHSARHQLTLQDHGYGASALHGGYVYSPCSFCWYSLHLPTEGWSGWVDLGGWFCTEMVYSPWRSSVQVLTVLGVAQLCWSRPASYH